jgi:hypothetical protein
MISIEQKPFLTYQAFSTSLIATAQRGKLYRENASQSSRGAFRRVLRSKLEALLPEYTREVSHKRHCANILRLADDLSDCCKDALKDGRFRIGSAQKALNLYLKLNLVSRPY